MMRDNQCLSDSQAKEGQFFNFFLLLHMRLEYRWASPRCWIPGSRSWTPGSRSWTPGSRSWALSSTSLELGSRSWMTGSRKWAVGTQF